MSTHSHTHTHLKGRMRRPRRWREQGAFAGGAAALPAAVAAPPSGAEVGAGDVAEGTGGCPALGAGGGAAAASAAAAGDVPGVLAALVAAGAGARVGGAWSVALEGTAGAGVRARRVGKAFPECGGRGGAEAVGGMKPQMVSSPAGGWQGQRGAARRREQRGALPGQGWEGAHEQDGTRITARGGGCVGVWVCVAMRLALVDHELL